MNTQNQPKKTSVVADPKIAGNPGQPNTTPVETESKLNKPGAVAEGKDRAGTPIPKKRKNELEVIIAPGMQDTSDIALTPPR